MYNTQLNSLEDLCYNNDVYNIGGKIKGTLGVVSISETGWFSLSALNVFWALMVG